MSYFATLTHDLKSPACAQINMLNLLLKGKFGKLNPKQYEMLKLTCSSAKYMSNLVGTVLSDYKCIANSIALNKTKFDIVALVNYVLLHNEYLISEKKLNIIVNAPEYLDIYADKLQLERVITNLISNALTYAFDNSVITVCISNINSNIIFTVSNKSYCIPERELKNIYNQFSQTINTGFNKCSTGLGLYVVKKIIALHGGQIFANSTPEGICTFGFKLGNRLPQANVVNNLFS